MRLEAHLLCEPRAQKVRGVRVVLNSLLLRLLVAQDRVGHEQQLTGSFDSCH